MQFVYGQGHTKASKPYDTTRKECNEVDSVVLFLRQYTGGVQFKFEANHNALFRILGLWSALWKLTRGQLFPSKFELDVVYWAGIKHEAGDTFCVSSPTGTIQSICMMHYQFLHQCQLNELAMRNETSMDLTSWMTFSMLLNLHFLTYMQWRLHQLYIHNQQHPVPSRTSKRDHCLPICVKNWISVFPLCLRKQHILSSIFAQSMRWYRELFLIATNPSFICV